MVSMSASAFGKHALLGQLLAVNTVPRPGKRLQAKAPNRPSTGLADSETTFVEAVQGSLDLFQQLALSIGDGKVELAAVGDGGAIDHVLHAIVRRFEAGTHIMLIKSENLDLLLLEKLPIGDDLGCRDRSSTPNWTPRPSR